MLSNDRAAMLPFPGDPFLLNYWLDNFKRWRHLINRLYIHFNAPVEPAVVEYIEKLCAADDKVVLKYTPHMADHGEAINMTLDEVEETYLMLIEDDCYVIKPEAIEAAFSLIESGNYEVVGSKRGSCSEEILKKADLKWGLRYTGVGDQGANFWPSFFFSKRSLLLKTSRRFGARTWKRGETLPGLNCDVEAEEGVVGDTFVGTSLEIRGMVPADKIAYVPQCHGHPEDLRHYEAREYIFNGEAPWVHIGSLSSGISGLLRDNEGRPLSQRHTAEPREAGWRLDNAPNTEMERMEYERRIQWFTRFYEFTTPDEGIADFYDAYGAAIQQVIVQFGLSVKNIRRRLAAYATLGL